ncbi:hypothetical protein [Kaistella carnis]|uniref:hypothetical protein n=1 Tax=Kaistella carnis TaxID=1241979 RepID=UPI0028AF83A5|nr:hypothetical protein [Kaistella carnis]
MAIPNKDLRIIRKEFESSSERVPDKIRLGNTFVDDFIFENSEAADIPINALRVIFNIISIIGNNQFRPNDRPHQLSLFEEEFQTDNNIFASIKIRNSKISPSGSTKQVVAAYEFLTKFKMGWYKSENSKGKEIKTYGGLISLPSYDVRGYTTFLISSYWLKKLMVIPEYNYLLYNLVYNIRNNKHVIFAIWLSKIPEMGTSVKLSTFNKKFGLNYKTANDFCFKFLKPARLNLNKYNNLSFNFKCDRDLITIYPYNNSQEDSREVIKASKVDLKISRRLNYYKDRYGLHEEEMVQFFYHYRNISQTRDVIEKAFVEFVRTTRMLRKKSTDYQGRSFLHELQKIIKDNYATTKMGELFPNGYPVII